MQRFNSILPRKIDGFFAVAFFILPSQQARLRVFVTFCVVKTTKIATFQCDFSQFGKRDVTADVLDRANARNPTLQLRTNNPLQILSQKVLQKEKYLPYRNNQHCVANCVDLSVEDCFPKPLVNI